MKYILRLIVIISISCFMCLAFRTNLREYKIHKEKLIREGNLPSPRTRIRGVLKTYGIMIGIALIIAIIVIYVRKLEFSISLISSTTLLCILFEIIIGSIVSLILEFIEDCKERGLIKGIIALLIVAILTAGILYVRYNW